MRPIRKLRMLLKKIRLGLDSCASIEPVDHEDIQDDRNKTSDTVMAPTGEMAVDAEYSPPIAVPPEPVARNALTSSKLTAVETRRLVLSLLSFWAPIQKLMKLYMRSSCLQQTLCKQGRSAWIVLQALTVRVTLPQRVQTKRLWQSWFNIQRTCITKMFLKVLNSTSTSRVACFILPRLGVQFLSANVH